VHSGSSSNNDIAIGNFASSVGPSGIAIGATAQASGNGAIGIGAGTSATGLGATAIGTGASVANTTSSAVGAGASTTANNQVALGTTGQSVWIPGNAEIDGSISNATFAGSITLNNSVTLARLDISSLANGGNSALPIGTNTWCTLSGPSGSFSLAGIASGSNGRVLLLENISGQQWTVSNQSGGDPVATNRIVTGTGSDITITNNPGWCELIYRGAVSRWEVHSHSN
jgi:hypothetical protein